MSTGKLLTETVFTALELTEAEDGYHHCRLLLTQGDKLNRKGRVYPMAIWTREIPRVKPKVKAGRFVGLVNGSQPFKTPSILDTVVRFSDIWIEEKDVYGDAILIPTEAGRDLIELARAGVKIGVESRGYGTTVKRDWTDPATGQMHKDVGVIQDDYELVAFDLVSRGSVKDAGVVRFEHFANGVALQRVLQEAGAQGIIGDTDKEKIKRRILRAAGLGV